MNGRTKKGVGRVSRRPFDSMLNLELSRLNTTPPAGLFFEHRGQGYVARLLAIVLAQATNEGVIFVACRVRVEIGEDLINQQQVVRRAGDGGRKGDLRRPVADSRYRSDHGKYCR